MYNFNYESLNFNRSYLTDRKQRIRINHAYNSCSDVTCGVLQGSILGPLLFNIDIFDMFLLNSPFDIASYADDDPTEDLVKTELEISRRNLFNWFRENRSN